LHLVRRDDAGRDLLVEQGRGLCHDARARRTDILEAPIAHGCPTALSAAPDRGLGPDLPARHHVSSLSLYCRARSPLGADAETCRNASPATSIVLVTSSAPQRSESPRCLRIVEAMSTAASLSRTPIAARSFGRNESSATVRSPRPSAAC